MASVVIAALSLSLLVLTALWGVRFVLLSRLRRKFTVGNAHSILMPAQPAAVAPAPEQQPSLASSVEKIASYPVKYLSEKSSHSLLRLVPWDASGTLSETDAGFHFVGSSRAGEQLEMRFPSDEARINYQRGSLLWDGGVSWCVIEVDGERHYFTSDLPQTEHSTVPQSNEVNTTVIYRNLTNRYIREG